MSRGALRVLIVDDERPARQKARRFVAADPDVGPIFEAANGARALDVIRDEAPDLMLLDIQMPGVDGFGVLDALDPAARPQVVFVTAYDQYAVRAFDALAVDYVTKPFDSERLGRALARAKEALARGQDRAERRRLERLLAAVREERPTPLERLLVESGGRALLVPLGRVDRLQAAGNYVLVHAGAEQFKLRATLDGLEGRLDPRAFVRVSRSTIVNTERIVELRPWFHGDYIVALRGGAEVRLSRRFRGRLERFRP